MGTQIVQNPADYRAVMAKVGIHDMLATKPRSRTALQRQRIRHHQRPGAVQGDPGIFAAAEHATAHRVSAVLMTNGANGPRVASWQSCKFTAALENATASTQPIILLTRMNAGHGIGAPFSQRVGDTAIGLTFFAHELGLSVMP
ncbi:hypothetical protein GCM10008098_25130 [Rhodanobacter panaciterrae]|uniref:Peptidase S9 prolyl oligopeptidase catalytic domain-containing protein n=1 Tax=Rhodanobacter panaciterrae TaxID=490572 RepID=A0ABQ3A0J8_9GAMM|nr:hypothetical protein GCM10008098_25130 [Rhodanobacter panaciterrae]